MKIRLIAFGLFCAVFVSCQKQEPNHYTIKGTAKELPNGEMIFLEREEDMSLVVIDTAIVEDGTFLFQGLQTEPELHFLSTQAVDDKIPVILETGEIEISLDIKNPTKTKLKGTYNNEELYQFRTIGSTKIQVEMRDFEQKNTQQLIQAQQQNDTMTLNRLQKIYQGFANRIEDFNNNYIEKHPSSYVSVLLLEDMMFNPAAKSQRLKKQFGQLTAELKNTKKGKLIQQALDKMNVVEVGMPAPDFSAPNPEGKIISLKESLGKVTLIDFWASWCKPCRQENPNVVAVYKKYHDKGFNIISVSLDKDAQDWKKAIVQDGLQWNHVSNLKSWQEPIAALYNVKSIPTTFLVDEKGVVIAKDLYQEDLLKKVQEVLGLN